MEQTTTQGGAMQKLQRFYPFSFISLLRATISNNCSLTPVLFYRFAIVVVLLFFVSSAQADQPVTAAPAIRPGEYQYKLIMSRDDKVCRHMLTLYNGDLKKYGYEKYDEHKEFTSIPWRESVNAVRQDGEKKIYRPMKAAYFDFNNDGRKELVIKDTDLLRGYNTDHLWVLSANQSDLEEISYTELWQAPNQISTGTGCYKLTQIEKSPPNQGLRGKQSYWCEGMEVLQPFTQNNVSYLSFRGLHISGERKFIVISKYVKGRLVDLAREDQAGVMADVCYLEKIRTAK